MASLAPPLLDLRQSDEVLAPQLREAFTTLGFLCLHHTGLEELQASALASSRRLFALPHAAKAALRASPATQNRGWTALGEETLDPGQQKTGDTKEGYYIGRDVAPGSAEAALPLHGPNVWPPEETLPGFRAAAEAYYAAASALGHRLTRVVALALGLDAGFFETPGLFDRPMLFLRLLRYAPVVSDPAAGVFAAGAHSDYGLLTLLATDDQPGLQIQPRGCAGDRWVPVAPVPGGLIVNVGDLLERWSGGVFASTRHRVVNAAGAERFSMPLFFEPNFDCLVSPLRPPAAGAPSWPPVRAGDYLLSRYADTHASYGGKPRAGQ